MQSFFVKLYVNGMKKRLIFTQHYLCFQHFSSRAHGRLLSLSGFWKCQSVRVANTNNEVTEPQLGAHCREKILPCFTKMSQVRNVVRWTKCTKKQIITLFFKNTLNAKKGFLFGLTDVYQLV